MGKEDWCVCSEEEPKEAVTFVLAFWNVAHSEALALKEYIELVPARV